MASANATAEPASWWRLQRLVVGQQELEASARPADAAQAAEDVALGQDEGAQEATPGEEHRDPVGDGVQLVRERIGGSEDVEDVGQAALRALASGLARAGDKRLVDRVDTTKKRWPSRRALS